MAKMAAIIRHSAIYIVLKSIFCAISYSKIMRQLQDIYKPYNISVPSLIFHNSIGQNPMRQMGLHKENPGNPMGIWEIKIQTQCNVLVTPLLRVCACAQTLTNQQQYFAGIQIVFLYTASHFFLLLTFGKQMICIYCSAFSIKSLIYKECFL